MKPENEQMNKFLRQKRLEQHHKGSFLVIFQQGHTQ